MDRVTVYQNETSLACTQSGTSLHRLYYMTTSTLKIYGFKNGSRDQQKVVKQEMMVLQ